MAPKKVSETKFPALSAGSSAAEPSPKKRVRRAKNQADSEAAKPRTARHRAAAAAASTGSNANEMFARLPPASTPEPIEIAPPIMAAALDTQKVAKGPVLVKSPGRRAAVSKAITITASRIAVPVSATAEEVLHEHVAVRAYFNWLERGCPHGSPEDDWFRAERDLVMLNLALREA